MGTGAVPRLRWRETCGVTSVSADVSARGAAFAFVGRDGGVSKGACRSLNVAGYVGDDPAAVSENRRRVLAVIGASGAEGRAIVPNQVHGARVVCLTSPGDLERTGALAREGADAVVVTVVGVPVLMMFADCVPVVLVAPGGIAVAHAGWRGALAGIAGMAARELASAVGCEPGKLWAYVGPHIAADSYEVSEELLARFVSTFGPRVGGARPRHLDLGAAVRASLLGVGVRGDSVVDCGVDTARDARWFSHRASGGACGRHAAVAWLGSPGMGEPTPGEAASPFQDEGGYA